MGGSSPTIDISQGGSPGIVSCFETKYLLHSRSYLRLSKLAFNLGLYMRFAALITLVLASVGHFSISSTAASASVCPQGRFYLRGRHVCLSAADFQKLGVSLRRNHGGIDPVHTKRTVVAKAPLLRAHIDEKPRKGSEASASAPPQAVTPLALPPAWAGGLR